MQQVANAGDGRLVWMNEKWKGKKYTAERQAARAVVKSSEAVWHLHESDSMITNLKQKIDLVAGK